jgi:hypothetical protein
MDDVDTPVKIMCPEVRAPNLTTREPAREVLVSK